MRIYFLILGLFTAISSYAQLGLSGVTSPNRATGYALEYFVYSTHGGNGAITDYPLIISNKTDFDKLFNTSNATTRLHSVGKTNSMVPLDWNPYTKLTAAGIAVELSAAKQRYSLSSSIGTISLRKVTARER